MRFAPLEHLDPPAWHAQRLALASSAGRRRLRQDMQRVPLLADVLPEPLPSDVAAALARRQRAAQTLERSLRALEARIWSEARRDYFAAPEPDRRAIRQAWASWRGPLRAQSFRYVVDVHTGVSERRRAAARERETVLRHKVGRQDLLCFGT